ncbi:MAG: hypothetical protein QW327_01890 [Candidatus Odinarchaeota archaeon]
MTVFLLTTLILKHILNNRPRKSGVKKNTKIVKKTISKGTHTAI